MHNKSFTADNQVTIIGGRNVGDEYFGAGQDVLFVDLDVLAIGPVVGDVSRDFDRYWTSDSAYPAARVCSRRRRRGRVAGVRRPRRATVDAEPDAAAYRSALARAAVRARPARRVACRSSGRRRCMVSDDPAKGLAERPTIAALAAAQAAHGHADDASCSSCRRISSREPTAASSPPWRRRGVKVSVLTNSLEATDVAAVHAGYAKRRKPLLEGGRARCTR